MNRFTNELHYEFVIAELLKSVLKNYNDKIIKLETQKYDLELIVRIRDFEVRPKIGELL